MVKLKCHSYGLICHFTEDFAIVNTLNIIKMYMIGKILGITITPSPHPLQSFTKGAHWHEGEKSN